MRGVFLALLLCSGCGGIPASQVEYQIGYNHGCESARYAAGDKALAWRADYLRDHNSTSYIPGWQSGFYQCRAKYTEVAQ